LNSDMQMLKEMAEQALAENRAAGNAGAGAAPVAAPGAAPAEPGRHVLLSGYQGLSGDKH
jgi:hypothetical protein